MSTRYCSVNHGPSTHFSDMGNPSSKLHLSVVMSSQPTDYFALLEAILSQTEPTTMIASDLEATLWSAL